MPARCPDSILGCHNTVPSREMRPTGPTRRSHHQAMDEHSRWLRRSHEAVRRGRSTGRPGQVPPAGPQVAGFGKDATMRKTVTGLLFMLLPVLAGTAAAQVPDFFSFFQGFSLGDIGGPEEPFSGDIQGVAGTRFSLVRSGLAQRTRGCLPGRTPCRGKRHSGRLRRARRDRGGRVGRAGRSLRAPPRQPCGLHGPPGHERVSPPGGRLERCLPGHHRRPSERDGGHQYRGGGSRDRRAASSQRRRRIHPPQFAAAAVSSRGSHQSRPARSCAGVPGSRLQGRRRAPEPAPGRVSERGGAACQPHICRQRSWPRWYS